MRGMEWNGMERKGKECRILLFIFVGMTHQRIYLYLFTNCGNVLITNEMRILFGGGSIGEGTN